MKRRTYIKSIIFLVLLGLVFAVSLLRGRHQQPAAIMSAEAVRISFDVVVNAVGELDASVSKVLVSQIRGDRGKIVHIVPDGTKVQKGDILVRLDPTYFEEEVARLSGKVREWKAVVSANHQILEWEKVQSERERKTLEFDLRATELDLIKLEKGEGPLELYRLRGAAQEAKQDWQQKEGFFLELKALYERGFVNITELNQAQARVQEAKDAHEVSKRQFESYKDYVLPSMIETAHAQVARAKMNLEQLKRGAGYKIGKAAAALRKSQESLESTETSLKSAQTELERTVIRAPTPGIAVLPEAYRGGIQRKPRIGDVVYQNQAIVYLPDISKMVVKTKIREIDLYKVGVGKNAVILVDAFPDLRLQGKVDNIGVMAKSRPESPNTDKYFQVVISVSDEDDRLRPGMTARVKIECDQIENALSVPVHSIFNEHGKYYCYVDINKSYQKKEVAIGAQSEHWAQVLKGLHEGEHVTLSKPPAGEIKTDVIYLPKKEN